MNLEKRKALVIINEQHSLLPEQELLLTKNFPSWEFLKVPSKGWDLKEINLIHSKIINTANAVAVFVSPVPALMKVLTGYPYNQDMTACPFYVFHNSRRDKKELPNGKVISVVAKKGWEIV